MPARIDSALGQLLGYEPFSKRFSAEALRKVRLYPRPGNVRELENVISRAVVLTSHSVISPEAIVLPELESLGTSATFQQLKAEAIRSFEREYLVELLRSHHGNISQAAVAAGKERRTFWQLLRKHRLTIAPGRRLRP